MILLYSGGDGHHREAGPLGAVRSRRPAERHTAPPAQPLLRHGTTKQDGEGRPPAQTHRHVE